MEKSIDLTGKRFGRWTVVGKAEDKGNKTYWHCKCDCGNEKDVYTFSLIKGKSKSCGCLQKETQSQQKIKDLTGQRFGKLLVISKAENIGNKVAWNCVCDCGNHIVVKAHNLYRKESPTISCGCEHQKPKYDLTGKRFGKLFVVGLSSDNEKTIKDGQKRWECKCDCGNTAYILTNTLLSGSAKGCGCLIGKNLSEKSNLRDLTGQKFGRLTVLKRAENIQYKSAMAVQWECRCDCGKTVIRRSTGLLQGYSKSCGCLREEIGNNPFEFEVGQEVKTKYGKFVIKEKFREERENTNIKDKKYVCKCLNCGETGVLLEHTIKSGNGSCRACSDSRSFGERFFYWFIKQLEIDFDTEYSPDWAKRKKYDFHFVKNGNDYIVEIDGAQHLKMYANIGLSYDEVVKIDKEKDKMAKENNHIIIRINCEQSKGMYIAENIKKSVLSEIFDLLCIDWKKCFYMAMSTRTRAVCDLWNEGHQSAKEIAEIIGSNPSYVSRLLVECAEFELCDYNSEEEKEKGRKKALKNSKKLICTDNGIIFQGAQECSRQSEKVFGIHLDGGGINRVCRKERKSYKGFHFEYVED